MQKKTRHKWVPGGITSPQGFSASGVRAGIKPHSPPDKKDVALIFSAVPATAAGVFTRNRVKAAPVILCRRRLKSRKIQAVIINSGNANACTGPRGLADAEESAAATAGRLRISPALVFVCSTGTIGVPMPLDRMKKGINRAVEKLGRGGGRDAARAIMTTDTRAKEAAVRLRLGGKDVVIGAMAKGAGMIAPRMATLLVFITTDAAIAPAALQDALSCAVEESFNRILVDGDQSTNDTVLCLASGLAGNRLIAAKQPAWDGFKAALTALCRKLAYMLVEDGEGVTRVVRLDVKGAKNRMEAEKVARAIARSPLVKTSWFGADPNWGRIMGAIGYSGAAVDPERISIDYEGRPAVVNGRSSGLPSETLKKIIARKKFAIGINLRQGKASYSMLTCDCSLDYVRINADYMT